MIFRAKVGAQGELDRDACVTRVSKEAKKWAAANYQAYNIQPLA
jgi:hypothetical protein